MNTKTQRSLLTLLTLLILLAILACQVPTPPGLAPLTPTSAVTATPPPPGEQIEISEGVYAPGFAGFYKLISVDIPQTYQVSNYTLPITAGTVSNVDRFNFNARQNDLLNLNGFVVKPAQWLEYFQVYEATRYQDVPVFITTDSIYHVYHLVFNKLLRDLERERLSPTLETLTQGLAEAAERQYQEARETALEQPALQTWGYFVVAQQLLTETPPPIPTQVQAQVNAELELIYAHSGIAKSPILTPPEFMGDAYDCRDAYCEDYSQYVPRGHYTRGPQLERYFRAMMWYGRINLRLAEAQETRVALLITHLTRSTSIAGRPAMDLWYEVYEPTSFLVGKSDDLGIHEYGYIMDAVYGGAPTLALLADDAKLATFTQAARTLPPPQINSMWVHISQDKDEVTQGFRFMGQRFVLDAYIFEQLTHREVENRWLPLGLDVFAAMGNETAYALLDDLGETQYINYDINMAQLREQIAALGMDSWAQNVYWNWLYALQAIVAPKGESYPPFMRTEAWAKRDLHTALGSWTELKHDTVLYAKQVMAEMGGGGEVEIPRGYVEPNPEAYARLLALTRMTRAGLESRDLLLSRTSTHLNELEDTLIFLQNTAEQELAGQALTLDEYSRIMYYGGWLEMITLSAADTEEGEWTNRFSDDEQAAIVTDVATDPNGYVLQEATGYVFEIYVVVPDTFGGLQVARGGSYAYYEFPWPMSERLTNEAWRAMLKEGQQPPQPEWTGAFIAP